MSFRLILGSLLFPTLVLLAAACGRRPAQTPAPDAEKSGPSVVDLGDFSLDAYEVTNRQYAGCVAAGVCVEPANTLTYRDPAYADHPVVFVTLDMASTYCRWRGARLPTKAEWENAAGEELAALDSYWGSETPVCQVGARLGAGIEENAEFEPGTQPVGGAGPNAFGLYDMTGSVWEWVQDRPAEGENLSPASTVSFLRMSSWSGYGPVYRRFVCGFRCARSP